MSNYNQIIHKRSSVQNKAPIPNDLSYGELAINYTDCKLYFKDSSNNVRNFDILPDRTNHSGKSLTTDGSTIFWSDVDNTFTLSTNPGDDQSSAKITLSNSDSETTSVVTFAISQTDSADGLTVSEADNTITLSHANTSTLSGQQGSAGIKSISVDGMGHVTSVETATYLTSVPSASTSASGIVQLSSATDSTSTSLAATASAVKSAYDLANAAIPSSQKGVANGIASLDSSGLVPSAQLPLAGVAVTNDTLSSSTFFIGFTSISAGSLSTVYTSDTKLTYQPSSGTLSAIDVAITSDRSKKENIRPIEFALDKVLALNGVNFSWKDTGERSLGLIAQEVEPFIPEVVHENNETGIKSVSYGNLVGLLIEAIKEQQKLIDNQQAQIDSILIELNNK